MVQELLTARLTCSRTQQSLVRWPLRSAWCSSPTHPSPARMATAFGSEARRCCGRTRLRVPFRWCCFLAIGASRCGRPAQEARTGECGRWPLRATAPPGTAASACAGPPLQCAASTRFAERWRMLWRRFARPGRLTVAPRPRCDPRVGRANTPNPRLLPRPSRAAGPLAGRSCAASLRPPFSALRQPWWRGSATRLWPSLTACGMTSRKLLSRPAASRRPSTLHFAGLLRTRPGPAWRPAWLLFVRLSRT
mmetsp:Transcript_22611/g.85692  ORF Transcript_22611/g.85692 Transcript_22611/m.85692 type:complete len:250 (+) Transcript_22611:3601-4350(+)